MTAPKDHFRSDGTCDCPFDGECISCKKPCNDHNLIADYYMCNECLDESFKEYERMKGKGF